MYFFLQSDTGTNYYKEIPLSEILAVDANAKVNQTDVQHCFEIRTANVDYLVGQNVSKTANNNSQQSGMGTELAKEWEAAVRKALMPVIQGGAVGAPPATHHHR